MTLRLRLTVLFALLLGGTLLLFGSLVYGLVNLTLLRQIDVGLSRQAEAIIAVLKVNSTGQYDVRPLSEFTPADNNLVFQLWGNDRRLQFSLPRSWQTPIDPAGRQSGRTLYNTVFYQGNHLRVLSLPLQTPRGPVGVLQVGVNLYLLDATQTTLSTVLGLLAIATMLLAGLIASLTINRALAPLTAVTELATTITRADDLSRRIPFSGSAEDEVGRLITAFNETLKRLEDLFATQRRFVADVSHELRTPLTVIKGEVSLMRRMDEVDEESLKSIESEVDRLTRLVTNLLLLAQAESGKLPLDMKRLDLDTLFLEVFQQARTLAGDKLSVELTDIEPVVVLADRDRIKQVMINLTANAVQYTPQGGRVAFSLKKVGDRARLIISDTGPGIPAQDLPHIFERFYRSDTARTRSSGTGFGLGLSITQWIIRNHNGTIEVQSGEGKGTSFIVYLPLAQEEQPK